MGQPPDSVLGAWESACQDGQETGQIPDAVRPIGRIRHPPSDACRVITKEAKDGALTTGSLLSAA